MPSEPTEPGVLPPPPPEEESLPKRLRRILVGPPRSIADQSLFHRLSLIAFLAWVGLGADGLSSSAYGPEEAFRTLGRAHLPRARPRAGHGRHGPHHLRRLQPHHRALSRTAAAATSSRPSCSGERAGVVSGAALLVDYVLTITISIAAAGDALFSFLPPEWQGWKLPRRGRSSSWR